MPSTPEVSKEDIERYTLFLFFGLMNVTKESDALLVRRGLWRNHHRVLDTLGRGVARSLSDLANSNGTSKQALHKSIQGLLKAKMVQVEVDALNRRAKAVKLTPAGRRFEAMLDDCQHRVFYDVVEKFGKEKMEIWAEVMEALANVPVPDLKHGRKGTQAKDPFSAPSIAYSTETPATPR